MRGKRNNSGEIMLEAIIVLTITLFMLLWILGIGFLHYQRYLVTIVANDAAEKIAANYFDPTRDLIMGYVEPKNLQGKSIYLTMNQAALEDANHERADKYVDLIMKKTNFTGVVQSTNTTAKLVQDSKLRYHVEVKVNVKFKTPFYFALKWANMDSTVEYSSTGRAECTDITSYTTSVDFISNFLSLNWSGSKVVKYITSNLKMKYSHVYAK